MTPRKAKATQSAGDEPVVGDPPLAVERRDPASEPTPRLWAVGLLLALGIGLWWAILADHPIRLLAVVLLVVSVPASIAVGMTPRLGRAVGRLLYRLRHPTPATATRVAVVVGVVAGLYLFATAWWQGAELVPRLSDESSYLIQARMLAEGYLWHAPHPANIAPFFDTLNLLVWPTYGSMYFPGTAMFFVPAVWLGLPYWTVTLLISAACVGLLYRLMVDLVDGVYAIVAVLMLLGVTMFRALSIMLLSQTPMLLMGLLMMLAYVRWRRRFDWRWAALIGLLAGWSGITRPADALCYAVAIGIAMLLDLRRPPAAQGDEARSDLPASGRPATGRAWLTTIACLVLPALPFLSLQVVQNVGMTGHWWEFPEARYADETYPAPMLGFHDYDLETWQRPASPRKRVLSETIERNFYGVHHPTRIVENWREVRLAETFYYGLPDTLLVPLIPVGLLGLRSRPRRALAVVLLFFVGFYAFYVFYIPHYMVVLVPPLTLLVLLGARTVERAIAAALPRAADAAAICLPLAVAALAIGALPELHPADRDHAMFPGTEPIYVEALLEGELEGKGPAIVLFRFDVTTYARLGEPVYNDDVAWIDDAEIVRANDLGAKNVELFRYYATTLNQPERVVYLYDARSGQLQRLGTAGELAH